MPTAPSGRVAEHDRAAAPYGCRFCATAACFTGDGDQARMPTTCPTRTHAELASDVSSYLGAERRALMRVADQTPMTPDRTLRSRVDELIFFARERGVRRLGVAYCVTLRREAQELARRLAAAGIEPELVCCRVGAIDMAAVALPKAHPDTFAATCNPVAQARLLNARGVDLVAQLGLCLGHDLVLQEECTAPVTTLAVKDRVHDNAPLRALQDARPATAPGAPPARREGDGS
jgi:uncharacterized metal-binding protein